MKIKSLLYYFIWSLLAITSCNTGNSGKNGELLYWSSNNNGEIKFSRKMVDSWNEKTENNRINYQPVPEGQSSEEIILAAVVGKTTPDIYSNMWQGSVEFYAKAKVLVALDTLDGFWDFIRDRCDSATIEEITSLDGHIYQIPWKINPFMTIYNKGIFKSLGLDSVPETYSEYLSAAKKFRKDFDGDGKPDQWFGDTSVKLVWYQRLFNFYPLYLAASDGMPLIKNNRAVFNNKYAIEVFGFLQEIYKQKYFTNDNLSASRDPFITQQIATKFTGPWEIEHLKTYKPADMEYDYFTMPVPDDHTGPVYTYCDPKSMVIFNTCKNAQQAFNFIKSMTDLNGDLNFIQFTNQLPRRKGLDTLAYFSDFFEQNPKLKPFAKQAKYVKGADNCEVFTEVFDIISQEYEACVLYNMKSPEDAIRDAERAVNVLLRVKD